MAFSIASLAADRLFQGPLLHCHVATTQLSEVSFKQTTFHSMLVIADLRIRESFNDVRDLDCPDAFTATVSSIVSFMYMKSIAKSGTRLFTPSLALYLCAKLCFLACTQIGHQLLYGKWVAQCLLCSSGLGVYTFASTLGTSASISNSVSLSLCRCSSTRSLRPTSPALCPIGAISVDGLAGFSFVTSQTRKTPTLVVVPFAPGLFLTTNQGRKTRVGAAGTSCSRCTSFVCLDL